MKKTTALLSLLSLTSFQSFAQPSNDLFFQPKKKEITIEKFFSPKYLIAIDSADKDLGKETCQTMKSAIKKLYHSDRSQCVFEDTDKDLDELQKKHSYYLTVKDSSKKENSFDIQANNLDGDEYDFKKLKWTVNANNKNKYLDAIETIAVKVVDYDLHSDHFREALFYRGIAESQNIIPKDETTFIIKSSGARVNKDIAFKTFTKESKQNKNYMRAGLELGAFLGLGKALYTLGQEAMKEDWDFNNKTWSDYKERLFTTRQMKFDDNTIGMNWGHAYAGVLYYHSARNNGFSSKESLIASLASSSIWEYFGENKEVVSINDQIITGIGGSIIGEAAYQISNMLKAKDSRTAKVLSMVFNPIGAFNDWLDGKTLSQSHRNFAQEYGYGGKSFSKFDLTYGLTSLANKEKNQEKVLAEVTLDTEVIHVPVDKVGKLKSVVYDPAMANIKISWGASQNGVEDFHSITKVVLAGYFSKDIKKDDKGNLDGHSFFIGPAMNTEYRSRGVGHEDDFFATVNIIGSTLDVTYYKSGAKVRFTVDVYADFAMVRPYAIRDYTEKGKNFNNAPSVLRKRDYYYATGYSSTINLEAEKGNLSGGLSLVSHYFDSIDNYNRDRHPERVIDKLELTDEYKSLNIWVGYKSSESTKIKLGLERIMREGNIHSGNNVYNNKDIENRVYLNIVKKI